MVFFKKSTALCYVAAYCAFSLGVSNYIEEISCPCKLNDDTRSLKSAPSQEHLLCIEDTEAAKSFFASLTPSSLNLNYRLLQDDFNDAEISATASSKYNSRDCDVLMKIVSRDNVVHSRNGRCPGVCKSIPFVLVPSYFLDAVLNSRSSSFQMCSMNLTSSHEKGMPSNSQITLGRALSSIATRRLQECQENKDPLVGSWDYVSSNPTKTNIVPSINRADHSHDHELKLHRTPRRIVYGVIIWVTFASKRQTAYNQPAVLRLQKRNITDSDRIVGWVATDDLYSCGAGRRRCSINNDNMTNVLSNPGSVCAHRRPLRAIAHVIKLFDPDFLLVADDSTYVNMKMLLHGTLLSSYILQQMRVEPIVIGDMRISEVTGRGIYSGEGGYLLGKAVLGNLSSRVIHARTIADGGVFVVGSQIEALSVLDEALEMVEEYCDKCAQVRPPVMTTATNDQSRQFITADIEVRVVELCVNLMAGMGTCYHSDHSLTRCLAHAVYADTISAGCGGFNITSSDGSALSVVMCSDAAECDLSKSLTCHKYMTDPRSINNPPISIHQIEVK
jgi:hypothetical protein